MIYKIEYRVRRPFLTTFGFMLWISPFLLLFVPETCYPKIHFTKEHVVILVKPGEVSVTGHYFLSNTSKEEQSSLLSYPFCGKFPRKIDVTVFQDGAYSKLKYRRSANQNAIAFPVFFSPDTEQEIRIRYTQGLLENKAIYVLKSTKEWMENLLQATFEITVPKALKGLEISYQTDEFIDAGEYVIYRIMRKDFMPQQDLIISWEASNNE